MLNNNTAKMKPSKIQEMTKEQIRQAIQRKRECNAKAQIIVESLLEKGISEQYLLQCLPDINQSHFEDIIEERSIIHLCGYPICQKHLSEKDIPKQKYRISVKTNKVYDITTRKNFCSNTCYKAAMHIKNQMLTSPLWFREHEEIPTFNVLPSDVAGSGVMGQEVDVALIERVKVKAVKDVFTPINEFTSASLNEMTNDVIDHYKAISATCQENNSKDNSDIRIENNNNLAHIPLNITQDKAIENHFSSNSDRSQGNLQSSEILDSNITIPEESINVIERLGTEFTSKLDISKKESKKPVHNALNIVGEIIERPEKPIDPILSSFTETPKSDHHSKDNKKKLFKKKQPLITALTIEVERCLADWFTLDTILYLLGEEKVKEMVAHKGECIKEYLNNYVKGVFYNSNVYDQYQALCRKLNMLEIEDRRYDAQALKRETKPLPDYTIIQEESKKMQLKVKAFFAGETAVPEPDVVESVQTVESPETENFTQLPLVDKNAQNALRRKIVCQHLNKVLPDLLRTLGLLSLSISQDVRLLVNTFKLKANNIMFKPVQWTLIAIIFIKLLSLRDKRLEHLLEQQTAYQHMQLLLLSYKQEGGYLERLILWLTDIDRLLDTNDTQLTLE